MGFGSVNVPGDLSHKQDKLVGKSGQVVGFDKDGKPVAQDAPDTGVVSFKGRKGAVVPTAGDYTAADVGAVPTTRKVSGKALSADVTLTAEDVGAAAADHTHPTQTSVTGNAGTATKLKTARKIGSASFDGSADVTLAQIGAAASDHTHPTQTSVTGNAGTATKLKTARKIGNAEFDGSAAITLAQMGAAAADHTHPAQASVTGNAGTATKLATPRTIRTNLAVTTTASFDGSANITPGVTGILGIANGGTGNNSGYVRAGQKSGTTVDANGTAEGWNTTASGLQAHAEGNQTVASGDHSHAGGFKTIASASFQTAIGINNVEYTDNNQALFIVGKGNSYDNNDNLVRANAFRVKFLGVNAAGAYGATGADYAELFEWEDGNPDKEDRVGRFVALDGEKIRLAGPEDDFILGIISGNPSVVGDVHDDQWQGMFLYDIYGRPIWEDVNVPAQTVEEPDPEDPEKTITRVIVPAHTERRQKINPDYNNGQEYIPRSERPEWGCVGMMGKLVVIDDGTCEVNGWCKPGAGGMATASPERTDFRVMARIDETHVRVLILGRR